MKPRAIDAERHRAFTEAVRPHVLMLTNHGIHEWEVIPGLPDTGGQNVFVNRMSHTMARLGFRVTVVNRGGYPHPENGHMHRGVFYKDDRQRIAYIEDDIKAFVRKEDMHEQIPQLVDALWAFLEDEGTHVDLIVSHYWDAAEIGCRINERFDSPRRHLWIPHSVGHLKKKNVNQDKWDLLRVDDRITAEHKIVQEIDGIGATSSKIQESLRAFYGYETDLFLPPCIDTDRHYPMELADDDPVWTFLAQHSSLTADEIRRHKIVTEVSRTDTTKRKDVVIKAFAMVQEHIDDALLVLSIDQNKAEPATYLNGLINDLGVRDNVIVVGSVWDELPKIYAASSVYFTPSVMEGFGMSIQEAAATSVPAISSDLVPFAVEYLLGDEVRQIPMDHRTPISQGEGCFLVPADDVDGFAVALRMILEDDNLRMAMGKRALEITIPYFSWPRMTADFLRQTGIAIPEATLKA